MSRKTHLPNTQTREDRTLWRKIRRSLAKRRRQIRKQQRLSSNREADLYVHPRIASPKRNTSRKIVPFPDGT